MDNGPPMPSTPCMRLLSAALLSAGLLLGSSCATTRATTPAPAAVAPPPAPAPTPPPSPADAAKEKLQAMAARELESVGTQAVTLEGHALTLESHGPVQVTPATENVKATFTLDLGTESPVTCMLYGHVIDVGSLLTTVLDGVKGGVEFVGVRPWTVTAVEKNPALFVEARYLVTQGGQKALGQLKLMAYASESAPMLCMHDELGYRATFERVATQAAAEVERALADPKQTFPYRAVMSMKLAGQPVGFERTTWSKQKDGGLVMATISAMFVPRTATEWMASDSANVTWSEKDGTVKKKQNLSTSGTQVERTMTLTRQKGGTYTYSGKQQGKTLAGEVKTADGKGLASDLTEARAAAAWLRDGQKADLTFEEYVPSADPTTLSTMTMKKGGPGPRDVTLTMGPLTLQSTLDTAGLPERVSIQAGPVSMVQERLFVEGPRE